MTTVYRYGVTDEAQSLHLEDASQRALIRQRYGQPLSEHWKPATVSRATMTQFDLDVIEQADPADVPAPQPLRRVDFPGHALGLPVLSERAMQSLGNIMAPCGEFLELRTLDGETYWLFNVLTVKDALDENASEIVRLPDGMVMHIPHPVFKRERLGSALLFRIPQRRISVYVTGAFLQSAKFAGLTGLACKLVWSGE